MKKFNEFVKEDYDEYGMPDMDMDDYDQDAGEYDYEGAMAVVQLRTIIRNAETMLTLMEDDTNLPEWIQSKLTIAEDHIMSSANYLQSRMEE
jgi:hypothetical protein|tara:strand:+ start:704 stop:979 length:276 start_codon:yes stop_codon:yes gene_type:complete